MKLLGQLDLVCRRMGLAPSTAKAYKSWVTSYLRFVAARDGDWKHPVALGTADVESYLNHPVTDRRLSGSSQNQCLNALVFSTAMSCPMLSRGTTSESSNYCEAAVPSACRRFSPPTRCAA